MGLAEDDRRAALRAMLACMGALVLPGAAALTAPPPTPLRVAYPRRLPVIDTFFEYDWAVLRTALARTVSRYGPFELKPSAEAMSSRRVTLELATPKGVIDIFVRATSPDLEKQFQPIRIPVDKGLIGMRVLLVRKEDLPRFAAVRTLQDLRKFRVGQGKGWADNDILAAAGIPVVEGTYYEGLFAMLTARRFDFFSRSVDEVMREYEERRISVPEMALEPTLLLHYPLPRYFFVRRDAAGDKLAQRVKAGLEMMIQDGSLNALFRQHKSPLLEKLALHKRRVIELSNPSLSPDTPLQRSELWLPPGSIRP